MPLRLAVLALLIFVATGAPAREPACTLEQSVGALALIELERAGHVSPESVDPARTSVETVATRRLAHDRYRIVYRVRILERSGARHELITVQEASPGDCTAGHIEFFLASRDAGPAVKR
jgi:hypothetical protein